MNGELALLSCQALLELIPGYPLPKSGQMPDQNKKSPEARHDIKKGPG